MYCVMCGAENPDYARYCQKCGRAQPALERPIQNTSTVISTEQRRLSQKQVRAHEEQRTIAAELLSVDQKPDRCHACGNREVLRLFPFGLAKTLSTKQDWLGSAWSVAVSAISLPLLGYGGFQLPGKTSRLWVLKLHLVLCETCRRKPHDYSLHPWWHKARTLGFTRFLKEDELKKLRPA